MIRCKIELDLKPLMRLNSKLRRQIIRKAVTNANKIPISDLKGSVPVLTGALQGVIAGKVIAKSYSFVGIVGPKTRAVRKKKIPNLYAWKLEEKYGYLERAMGKTKEAWVRAITGIIASEVNKHR